MNCVTNISEQVVKCYVKGISWFNFIEGKKPTWLWLNLKKMNVHIQMDLLTNSGVNIVMNDTKKRTSHYSNISISGNWIKPSNTDDLTRRRWKLLSIR